MCDNGALQQKILQQLAAHQAASSEGQKLCVFQDINDRLTPTARNLLDGMTPDPSAPLKEAADAYKQMAAWLMTNRDWALRDEDPCATHDRMCSLTPELQLPQGCMADSPRPLRMHLAGNTCKGWSTVGKMKFFADASERPLGIWLADRRRQAERTDGLAEDIFFSECTVKYPAQA